MADFDRHGLGVGTATLVLATTRPAIVKAGQVATLAWYANNYETGGTPQSVATDGTNIWTANNATSAVSKINPATGAVVGTYPLPAQSGPRAIATDGTNILTANTNSNTVTKIQAR